MEETKGVGRCVGCGSHTVLTNNGCEACYTHPKRGKRFIELAKRVLDDRSFASRCYEKCSTTAAKNFFIERYGLPDGCVPPPGLKLVESLGQDGLVAKVIQFKRT